jgi:hypothetical protein
MTDSNPFYPCPTDFNNAKKHEKADERKAFHESPAIRRISYQLYMGENPKAKAKKVHIGYGCFRFLAALL